MFGVYVHFPYCRKRCPYCDFAVAVRKTIPHERYLRAVLLELAERADLFAGRRAVSVYFGGGTPSLWRPEGIAAVREAALLAFPPPSGVVPEVTLEADPKDLDGEVLQGLREAGVNRLSLGVQSLQDRHLVQLGRLHRAAEARAVVPLIREAGFHNLSLDLMIGLCGQRQEEFLDDLSGMLGLHPEHLSTYQLTIEPRTAYAASVKRGLLRLPDADVQAERYQRVQETLAASGYRQYEISSYARQDDQRDLRAVHNRLYWTFGEYLGLGASAHSFRHLPGGGGERFANVRGVDDYLADPGKAGLALHEELPPDVLAREALWLGLRQIEGISRTRFKSQHGYDPLTRHHEAIEKLLQRDLLLLAGDVLRLSRTGVLFADEVGARLL